MLVNKQLPITKKTDLYTKVLTLFMVIVLGICISVLSSLDASSLFAIIYPSKFMLGILTQFLVIGIFIFAWRINLLLCGLKSVSYQESVIHTGIFCLGKYIPGKIGGLVMRGVVVYRQNQRSSIILQATTIEQVAMVHSGLLICALLWAFEASAEIFFIVSIFSLASLLIVFFPKIVLLALRKLTGKFPRVSEKLVMFEQDFKKPYFSILALMSVNWLFSALSISLCLQSFSVEVPFQEMLLISTVSVLTGFIAFVLPAGIGAREGALVLLLSPYSNAITVLTVASLVRIIAITIDLIVGIYSLHKITNSDQR